MGGDERVTIKLVNQIEFQWLMVFMKVGMRNDWTAVWFGCQGMHEGIATCAYQNKERVKGYRGVAAWYMW